MTPEQCEALRAPFPPKSIGRLPKGGTTLPYVGHAAVTGRLLSVDPTWTWEPAYAYPGTDVPLPGADRGLWIRLTVAGVTRYGYGDGTGANAVKEAIGDALRNAAMRFGVALDLWSKEELESAHGQLVAEVVEVDPAKVSRGKPTKPDDGSGWSHGQDPGFQASTKQLRMIGALFGDLGISDRQERLDRVALIVGRQLSTSKDLTVSEASKVIDQLQALGVTDAPGTAQVDG